MVRPLTLKQSSLILSYLLMHACCSSSKAPSCYSYILSQSLNAMDTVTSFACGNSPGSVLALKTSTGGGKASPLAGGNISPTDFVTSQTQAKADTLLSSNLATSTSSSPSPEDTGSSSTKKDGGLSSAVITGIVIPVAAVVITVICAWWRRHQVVWLLTCGTRGHRHWKKPESTQQSYGYQLPPQQNNGDMPRGGYGFPSPYAPVHNQSNYQGFNQNRPFVYH